MFHLKIYKIMKKNFMEVVKVLRERVANSGLELNVYDYGYYDIQVSFDATDNIPLYGDVLGILTCFFKNPNEIIHVNYGFGFTEIYLSDGKWKSGYIAKRDVNLFLPKK